jgi:hypothetical protein
MEGKRRALKQKSSHASAVVVPTHIRVFGTNLTKENRTRIRQELGKKLGKFASALERVKRPCEGREWSPRRHRSALSNQSGPQLYEEMIIPAFECSDVVHSLAGSSQNATALQSY